MTLKTALEDDSSVIEFKIRYLLQLCLDREAIYLICKFLRKIGITNPYPLRIRATSCINLDILTGHIISQLINYSSCYWSSNTRGKPRRVLRKPPPVNLCSEIDLSDSTSRCKENRDNGDKKTAYARRGHSPSELRKL